MAPSLSVVHRSVFPEGDVTWLHPGHGRLIETEVVTHILQEFGARPRRSEVAQMVEQLRTHGHATLGGVMARRAMHRKDPLTEVDAWRFEREPPRNSQASS